MNAVREQSTKVAKTLGDSLHEVWSFDEIESTVADCYHDFTISVSALWDSMHIPDRHSPAYLTSKFDRPRLKSRRVWPPWVPSPGGTSRSNRSVNPTLELMLASDETPFLGGGQQFSTKDGLSSLITGPRDVQSCTDPPPRESLLPPEVAKVERVTYDGRRLTGVTPQEADAGDPQWEQYAGQTFAFALVSKGKQKLLKRYRGPATPSDMRPYTSEVGILRGGLHVPDPVSVVVNQTVHLNLTPFADISLATTPPRPISIITTMFPYPGFTPTLYTFPSSPPTYGWPALREHAGRGISGGPFGIPRRVPNAWFTQQPFGFPKRFVNGANNTRIDFVRRAQSAQTNRFEIQAWDWRYVRFYALSRLLDRDGPGQNKKMAQHYLDRYNLGVAMVSKRHADVREATNYVMGSPDRGYRIPALATFPPNYGVD